VSRLVERDPFCKDDTMENTLIPSVEDIEESMSNRHSITSSKRDKDNTLYKDSDDRLVTQKIGFSKKIEKLFPSSGIIIRDIYELFKTNKPTRERDSAIMNYVKLLFQK